MKRVEKYQAFDGVEFYSEVECRAYERRFAHARLAGLSIEQVEAALSRADPELADAIEQVGSRIARARLDAGEKRHERRPNAKDDAPARQTAGPAASADIRAGEERTSDFSSQNEAAE